VIKLLLATPSTTVILILGVARSNLIPRYPVNIDSGISATQCPIEANDALIYYPIDDSLNIISHSDLDDILKDLEAEQPSAKATQAIIDGSPSSASAMKATKGFFDLKNEILRDPQSG
ncbi:hypothetical protein GcM1_230071, partial [Golovinomyces cichoracearum]